jgi:hypothetical protein
MKKQSKQQESDAAEDKKFPLPEYKAADDIYNRAKEEPLDEEGQPEEGELQAIDKSLDDGLDIPGTELDDADETIGEEDEENNYYSLGGDNHDDLEESQE